MKLTLELLRLIGSPYAKTTQISNVNLHERSLYEYSKKNKISLLYLESLKKSHSLYTLEPIYRKEQAQYLKTLSAIARVSTVLAKKNIEHAVFKTVRPYKSTTVDIDIIVLGDKTCQKESLKAMLGAGYEMVTSGPMSVTLWDKEASIAIDLYEQVAVSYITYIDKEKLFAHVASVKLSNKKHIKSLNPEADLASIIAHSIIKEQMYTLSEYYTFIHYLKQLDVQTFLQIVKQNNLTTSTKTHASLTALLHRATHKSVPDKLQQIINTLGEENLEMASIIQNDFRTPHKYHILTVARALLEITKGKKTRESIATQILNMTNLDFAKKFVRDLMKHVVRETY
jgi:hypothetical protein